ncbi:hypothetical protein K2173_004082 [Erythroxylum novogranatense]|uniref:Uncharacterized protein n=1 Tax=Erythroxylum novogranatense TaxID=1862640 RepID=A0AAV8SKC7_9ROSI|nr:hypothetical protein K2173_004082 [Erythroxylum novogranatense]
METTLSLKVITFRQFEGNKESFAIVDHSSRFYVESKKKRAADGGVNREVTEVVVVGEEIAAKAEGLCLEG